MTLSGSDPYNAPSIMTISISVNFGPKIDTSFGTLAGVFIAQELSYYQINGGLFTDENMSTLTVTAAFSNGSSLPSWLTFSPPSSPPTGFYQFSGIYPNFNFTLINITLTAEDENGLSIETEVNIEIRITCHSTCLGCYGAAIDECVSCYTGRFLHVSTCKSQCDEGYFQNATSNTCDL